MPSVPCRRVGSGQCHPCCGNGTYTRPYKRPKFELLSGNSRSNHAEYLLHTAKNFGTLYWRVDEPMVSIRKRPYFAREWANQSRTFMHVEVVLGQQILTNWPKGSCKVRWNGLETSKQLHLWPPRVPMLILCQRQYEIGILNTYISYYFIYLKINLQDLITGQQQFQFQFHS